jgi:hypothetical protein
LRKLKWYNKEKKKIREGGRRKRGESKGGEERVTKKKNSLIRKPSVLHN